MNTILSPYDTRTFVDRGIVRVRGFLPQDLVTSTRDHVLFHLEKVGIRRGGDWFLNELPANDQPNVGVKLIKGLTNSSVGHLIGADVRKAVGELVDGRETFPLSKAQLLFTLPNAQTWTVPHHLWQLDLPRFADSGLPGVQIFTFLDTVEPGGGGTLVVAGSHRLMNDNRRMSSQQVKRAMNREPYFQNLMSADFPDRCRLLQEIGHAGEVELQVVELHGEPGDVYFTDLRLLHTIAPNASRRPRIMMTQRFLLTSLRNEVQGNDDDMA